LEAAADAEAAEAAEAAAEKRPLKTRKTDKSSKAATKIDADAETEDAEEGSDGESDAGSDGESDGGSDGEGDGGSDAGSDGESDGGSDGESDGEGEKKTKSNKSNKSSGSGSSKSGAKASGKTSAASAASAAVKASKGSKVAKPSKVVKAGDSDSEEDEKGSSSSSSSAAAASGAAGASDDAAVAARAAQRAKLQAAVDQAGDEWFMCQCELKRCSPDEKAALQAKKDRLTKIVSKVQHHLDDFDKGMSAADAAKSSETRESRAARAAFMAPEVAKPWYAFLQHHARAVPDAKTEVDQAAAWATLSDLCLADPELYKSMTELATLLELPSADQLFEAQVYKANPLLRTAIPSRLARYFNNRGVEETARDEKAYQSALARYTDSKAELEAKDPAAAAELKEPSEPRATLPHKLARELFLMVCALRNNASHGGLVLSNAQTKHVNTKSRGGLFALGSAAGVGASMAERLSLGWPSTEAMRVAKDAAVKKRQAAQAAKPKKPKKASKAGAGAGDAAPSDAEGSSAGAGSAKPRANKAGQKRKAQDMDREAARSKVVAEKAAAAAAAEKAARVAKLEAQMGIHSATTIKSMAQQINFQHSAAAHGSAAAAASSAVAAMQS
jgi:hypothetical protein